MCHGPKRTNFLGKQQLELARDQVVHLGTEACYQLLFYYFIIYLPTQISFPIGGERTTCHGPRLTYSLGKQQLELARDQVVHLGTEAGYQLLFYYFVIYLPTQISFPIGGERTTCHGPRLTYSLGKQQLELARDQVVHLETTANLCVACVKQISFLHFLSFLSCEA